jgi:hypothetical protein
MINTTNQWMKVSLNEGNASKQTDNYLTIEQPSTMTGSASNVKEDKFDFDLFSSLWANFELEKWILDNSHLSCDKNLWVTQYLTEEAVDQQIKTKLTRLTKTKKETEKVYFDMKQDRLKQIEKIGQKMGNFSASDADPFLPYEDPNNVGPLRRRKSLTFQENIELKNYQKLKGIPVYEAPKTPAYPTINKSVPLTHPIGKPVTAPVIPLPGQHHGYPNINQNNTHYSHMQTQQFPSHTPLPISSNNSGSHNGLQRSNTDHSMNVTNATYTSYTMESQTPAKENKKRGSGFKRLFGFS